MTTANLHQHFKVEYDKANVITAYPSFLPEEIDVWLNKANSMMINQKFTGNNTRRIAFEGDIKRIADLQGLINKAHLTLNTAATFVVNAIIFDLSNIPDYLFYIISSIKLDGKVPSEIILVSHERSKGMYETAINKPWIPKPIAVLEDDKLIVFYDTFEYKDVSKAQLDLTYIKKPAIIDVLKKPTAEYEFGDNIAYEVINLAVVLALENIESTRVSTKADLITLQE